MSAEAKPITVHILDKEYLVGCPQEEREALTEAAHFLDRRMREVRNAGKVIGAERIAVITALNITNEMLHDRKEGDNFIKSTELGIKSLTEKINLALEGDKSQEVE